jgi:hypothetical protein
MATIILERYIANRKFGKGTSDSYGSSTIYILLITYL